MPRYFINDYDERFRYMDQDGHSHDVALRDLTVEQLLAVVRYYKVTGEPSWNESTLTERLRAAMPCWDGDVRNMDNAIRRHWPDREWRTRPIIDV